MYHYSLQVINMKNVEGLVKNWCLQDHSMDVHDARNSVLI